MFEYAQRIKILPPYLFAQIDQKKRGKSYSKEWI